MTHHARQLADTSSLHRRALLFNENERRAALSAAPIPKKKAVTKAPVPPVTHVATTPTPTPPPTNPTTNTANTQPANTSATNTAKETAVGSKTVDTSPPTDPTGGTKTGSGAGTDTTGTALQNMTLGGGKTTSSSTPSTATSSSISVGTIIAIVGGVLLGLALIACLVVFFYRRHRRNRDHFSVAKFRRSAVLLDDGASERRPRSPSMIERHAANAANYSTSHAAYPSPPVVTPYTFPTAPTRSYSPATPSPVPGSFNDQENPFLPPAYTPSDTLSPTSVNHVGRQTTQSIPASVSEYSQNSFASQNTLAYVDMARSSPGPSSNASSTSLGYSNEKAGYVQGMHLANPSSPTTTTMSGVPSTATAFSSYAANSSSMLTATGYPNEKAVYQLQPQPPPAASSSSTRPNSVYNPDDVYGGM